jgi:hypothetical protein
MLMAIVAATAPMGTVALLTCYPAHTVFVIAGWTRHEVTTVILKDWRGAMWARLDQTSCDHIGISLATTLVFLLPPPEGIATHTSMLLDIAENTYLFLAGAARHDTLRVGQWFNSLRCVCVIDIEPKTRFVSEAFGVETQELGDHWRKVYVDDAIEILHIWHDIGAGCPMRGAT